MLSQNEKNRVAYLTALALLFSYAELLLPRVIPFFRLGLGNIVLLCALELSFAPYMLLAFLKSAAASIMAGTLFSPFFILSFVQSALSAALMYVLWFLNLHAGKKLLSIYGISLAGSVCSAFVQIFLSAFYLGRGTLALLGPMIFFNTFSGIFTAFLAQKLCISKTPPALCEEDGSSSDLLKKKKSGRFSCVALVFILIFALAIFLVRPIGVLCAALFISLVLQKIFGRKILILPHVWLWLFVLVSCLFVPQGKVLFKIFSFSVTQGALLEGVSKALKLSSVAALSQCAAGFTPSKKTLAGLSLAYYTQVLKKFHNVKGSLLFRLRAALGDTPPQL